MRRVAITGRSNGTGHIATLYPPYPLEEFVRGWGSLYLGFARLKPQRKAEISFSRRWPFSPLNT